MEMKIDRQ